MQELIKQEAGHAGMTQVENKDELWDHCMNYRIDLKDDTLVLRSTSFKTETGSVLHSGIFNRELASSLFAGALLLLCGFFFAVHGKITAVHLVLAVLAFAVLFLLFRTYVFLEPTLEVRFDRRRGTIDTSLRKATGMKRDRYLMSELSGVRLDHRTVQPENPDGIKVIERIALQHGMVIPGFGETTGLNAVQLDFPDRSVTLFITKDKPEAETLVAKLNGFIHSARNCRER